jgi:hypothetical protein
LEFIPVRLRLYSKFIGNGDALDPILMANCPTCLEFGAIDFTWPKNQILVDLDKANNKLCTIIVPSEGKSHRMALPSKTRNDDYPNRLA